MNELGIDESSVNVCLRISWKFLEVSWSSSMQKSSWSSRETTLSSSCSYTYIQMPWNAGMHMQKRTRRNTCCRQEDIRPRWNSCGGFRLAYTDARIRTVNEEDVFLYAAWLGEFQDPSKEFVSSSFFLISSLFLFLPPGAHTAFNRMQTYDGGGNRRKYCCPRK